MIQTGRSRNGNTVVTSIEGCAPAVRLSKTRARKLGVIDGRVEFNDDEYQWCEVSDGTRTLVFCVCVEDYFDGDEEIRTDSFPYYCGGRVYSFETENDSDPYVESEMYLVQDGEIEVAVLDWGRPVNVATADRIERQLLESASGCLKRSPKDMTKEQVKAAADHAKHGYAVFYSYIDSQAELYGRVEAALAKHGCSVNKVFVGKNPNSGNTINICVVVPPVKEKVSGKKPVAARVVR